MQGSRWEGRKPANVRGHLETKHKKVLPGPLTAQENEQTQEQLVFRKQGESAQIDNTTKKAQG